MSLQSTVFRDRFSCIDTQRRECVDGSIGRATRPPSARGRLRPARRYAAPLVNSISSVCCSRSYPTDRNADRRSLNRVRSRGRRGLIHHAAQSAHNTSACSNTSLVASACRSGGYLVQLVVCPLLLAGVLIALAFLDASGARVAKKLLQ